MINTELFNHCSVLIVDDQSTSRGILSQMIRGVNSKIQVTEKESSVESIKWASEHTADLVFVDYEMPEMNGIEFVRLLRTLTNYASVPVVMITIKNDAKTRYEALNSGMTDFLSKPLDIHECTARTKNLLTMRCQHTELEHKSWTLEQSVKRATEKIKLREKETLIRLARAGEYKDFDTAMHLRRISLYSRLLAEAIGFDETEAELIELASPLHDIGKIGIPDSILLKKGALDPGELKIMRDHTRIGYEILQDSPSEYLQMGGEIALAHHEQYDGGGYPFGLSGTKIPISARIVSIVDVFDALTSERPYKKAWGIEESLEYLRNESGKRFDPELVTALLSLRPAIEKISNDR